MAVVVGITGAALVARLIWLDEIPPGLYYDEAFEALDALTMLRDRTLPVFFPGNFGREPLFIWLLAFSQGLFGAEPVVIRTTAGLVGALTVPALYLATRELLGRLPALFAAAILPFTLWHLIVTRIALRFVLLPLLLCLAVWLMARGLRTGKGRDFALAGLAFAGCLATYTAARLVPLLIGLAALGVLLIRPRLAARRWRAALWLPVVATIALLPLGWYFIQNPLAFGGRVDQVTAGDAAAPNPSFGPGDPGSIRENPLRTAGMFLIAGDQNLRTNLPGRPVFDSVMGTAFILGLVAAVTGQRRFGGIFVLAWLVIMAIPSAISTYAPHYARAIGALPAAAALAGLGLATVVRLGERLGRGGLAVGAILAVGALVWSARLTVWDYFDVWANDLGTYTAFDTGIYDLGLAMRSVGAGRTAYVSPISGMHPTLVFASRRDDIRGYDGRAGIILAAGDPAVYGVVVGVDRTTEPALGDAFPGATPTMGVLDPVAQPWAVLTPVDGVPILPPARPVEALFAEAGQIVGAAIPVRLEGRILELTLSWRAAGPTERPLTAFVQLLDGPGRVIAQHDSQPLAGSYPTTRWAPGETIVERHRLNLPDGLPTGEYRLLAGLYDVDTGRRISATGRDAVGDAALVGNIRR
ncbi:MAG: glycosyltransferase family 39 protein [Dehalococcoidia bacterium]